MDCSFIIGDGDGLVDLRIRIMHHFSFSFMCSLAKLVAFRAAIFSCLCPFLDLGRDQDGLLTVDGVVDEHLSRVKENKEEAVRAGGLSDAERKLLRKRASLRACGWMRVWRANLSEDEQKRERQAAAYRMRRVRAVRRTMREAAGLAVAAVRLCVAWEAQVVGQLQQICGEPTTWSTKKKVIDQFKASVMWDGWISAGHNVQQLVGFISRLQAKHLNQVGGAQSGMLMYMYIYIHTHTHIYICIYGE